MQRRREFLRATGATLAAVGLAGCSGGESTNGDETTAASTETADEATTTTEATDSEPAADVGVDAAVAAQWNVYRARLADAAVLGAAGDGETGARLVTGVFEDFEAANGEHGAHEVLEETSTEAYEGFEAAVVGLREALTAGDDGAAAERAQAAAGHLRAAQRRLVGEPSANALDVLAFGDRAATARALADAAEPSAAAVAANAALSTFETAPAHDALESSAPDAYEAYEGALGDVLSAGQRGDAEAAKTAADEALAAAVEGAYAVAEGATTQAGHVASVQSRAYDAAALAALGGPATAFGHAAVLTTYRARAQDAAWLAAAGEADPAATMAIDVLEHFEGAAAHEPLEEADHDAYEGFEGGVADLQTAIEDGADTSEALAQVDENLVAGVGALATDTEAAVLEAVFLRARLGDAREHYQRGEAELAAAVAEHVFERFERDELGVHEALEDTSEDRYHTFEEDHLSALPDAMRNGEDDAVAEHVDGAQAALGGFTVEAASTARVSGVEAAYLAARGFDAAALAAAGHRERAATVADDAMTHFEAGAGGFHEAVEDASEDTYHAFEEALVRVSTAASESDGDVYAAAQSFGGQASTAVYDVLGAAGGDLGASAAGVVDAAYRDFEAARVHEPLEDADHDAYEGFESGLETYATGLESGDGDASTVARASLRAQFALAGDADAAPVGEGDSRDGSGDSERALSGGPNVVEGVPDDADHVVDMTAVAFEPKQLTVQAGDTVAWKHAGGEPHSVTAYEDEIPGGADYWASGGFDGQDEAVEGWEHGEGAVTEGEAYVHTFETAGEHAYYCIPHAQLGMKGTVVVED
jgi:plastocyanin